MLFPANNLDARYNHNLWAWVIVFIFLFLRAHSFSLLFPLLFFFFCLTKAELCSPPHVIFVTPVGKKKEKLQEMRAKFEPMQQRCLFGYFSLITDIICDPWRLCFHYSQPSVLLNFLCPSSERCSLLLMIRGCSVIDGKPHVWLFEAGLAGGQRKRTAKNEVSWSYMVFACESAHLALWII